VAFEKFKSSFNVVGWRLAHPAINYPGKYTGRYLVDLFLSEDKFEQGYIDWLIKEGAKPASPEYSAAQHENFQKYVREAHELNAKRHK
jgi:hypothetical protein